MIDSVEFFSVDFEDTHYVEVYFLQRQEEAAHVSGAQDGVPHTERG